MILSALVILLVFNLGVIAGLWMAGARLRREREIASFRIGWLSRQNDRLFAEARDALAALRASSSHDGSDVRKAPGSTGGDRTPNSLAYAKECSVAFDERPCLRPLTVKTLSQMFDAPTSDQPVVYRFPASVGEIRRSSPPPPLPWSLTPPSASRATPPPPAFPSRSPGASGRSKPLPPAPPSLPS